MIAYKAKGLSIFFAIMFFLSLTASHAETFKYNSHGKRDPFIPLIGREGPSASVSFAEIASIDDVRLEGIVMSQSGARTAIINGEMVKEYFKSGEVEVRKISKDSVVLSISGKKYTIKLSDEGGITSE